MQKVAILGSGIIGAAIANELARTGNLVTLFAKNEPTREATPNSFGWINAHSPHLEHHFALRLSSMELWHGLMTDNPDLPASGNAAAAGFR